MTNDHLEEYLHILLANELAHSTLKSYFISLSCFFYMLVYKKKCQQNPVPTFRKIFLPRRTVHPDKRQFVPVDTARTIMRRAGHIQDKAIHMLLAKSGLRREELLILQEKDLMTG